MVEVLDRLARFEPTKIAVEVRAEDQAACDADYAAHRRGEHPLGASEVHEGVPSPAATRWHLRSSGEEESQGHVHRGPNCTTDCAPGYRWTAEAACAMAASQDQ